MREAEEGGGGGPVELFPDGGINLGPIMAVQVDPERGNPVEAAVAFGVGQPAALAGDNDRKVFLVPELMLGKGMPENLPVAPAPVCHHKNHAGIFKPNR